jgi:hypothetical protein
MRIRTLVAAIALAAFTVVPLAGPAQATHNCGFDPCPHPSDVVTILCWKAAKLLPPEVCGL